ncbi:CARDB domain-containing protein [Halobellus captivus]|uniref:CARDB domain-containing protein n=1 Tax=Halobellus captivus TaxID=2592614 RepID=UPI0011AA5946|nr:CARDB domain-containing protein [Halobellus captivus]
MSGNVTGSTFVGGAVGSVNGGTLENVSASGDVQGSESIGGLTGDVSGSGLVEGSEAESTVNGQTAVGGFVGSMTGRPATVTGSTAESDVNGTSNVGGFAGLVEASTIKLSSATGSVTASERVGGFVGNVTTDTNGYEGQVVNSYTTTSVETIEETQEAGGFVGVLRSGSVITSYAAGSITGAATETGGLVGHSTDGTVTDSYWDTDVSGVSASEGGTGLTTSQMTGDDAKENMTGFDFFRVWKLTTTYPEFKNQYVTAEINGSLSGPNGASLAGDSVGAFYEADTDDDDVVGADTEIEADGGFEINDLPASQTYNLVYGDTNTSGEHNGVPDLYAIDRVTPPETVTETLPEAHNVTIRVTDEYGNPIENADVLIQHTNGEAFIKEGERNATNDTGYLSVGDSTSLELVGNISVEAEFNGVENSTEVEVASDRMITVELAGARVNGTLTSASESTSLEGDTVGIFTQTEEDGIEGIDTTVGQNGQFEIGAALSGEEYTLAFGDDEVGTTPNGVPDLYAIQRVTAPADVDEVTIPKAHNVTVRVIGQNGDGIEGAGVAIGHANGDATVEEGQRNATNESGYLTLDGASTFELVDDVTVYAESNGLNASTTVSVDSDQQITVELTRPEVTGSLSAESGTSLENDSVSIYREIDGDNVERIDATVDADGNFTISGGSADATYNLVYGDTNGSTEPNGVPDLYAIDRVSPPDDVGEVTLPEASNVSIRVVKPGLHDDSPIEAADVMVSHRNGSAEIREGERRATNENGYLVVNGSTSLELVGNVSVWANYNGFNNSTDVEITGDREITVELSGHEVSGTVTADGQPVSNGTVTYSGIEEWSAPFWSEAVTSEDGTYRTDLLPALYSVEFVQRAPTVIGAPAFPTDRVPDVYAAEPTVVDDPTQNDLTLPKANRLQVRVVDESGDPISGEQLGVTHINGENRAGLSTLPRTNETGWINFSGTSNVEVVGTVELDLKSQQYVARETIEVTSDETYVLEAKEVVNVTGSIANASGDSVANGTVFARSSDGSMSADAPVGESGEFELELASNSTYELGFRQDGEGTEVNFPEDGIPDIQSITVVETGTEDDSIGTQQLGVGHPLDISVVGPEENPVDDVTVFVSDNNDEEDFAVGLGGGVNETGSFVPYGTDEPGIEVNGSIDVYVDAPEDSGLADASERNIVVDGASSRTIQLQEAASVNGTILQPDGETAADEVIQVNAVKEGSTETVSTDANGYFDARVAADGAYYVGFVQGDADSPFGPPYPQDGIVDVYAIENVTSAEAAALGPVTLPKAHNLTVNVVGPEGNQVEDATVRLWSTENDAYQWGGEGTVTDGTLHLEANGSVDIEASAPEGTDLRSDYERVDVTEDETVNITLDRNVTVSGSVEYANGTPATGYTAELFGQESESGDHGLTNETGFYELNPEPNQFYSLGVKQTDLAEETVDFPKDGQPDLHTFGAIEVEDEDRNAGERTLPQAHLVNVTVENESGEPVSDADVGINVLAGSFGAHHPATTRGDGEVVLAGSSTPGVEVNGTLRVSVAGTDEYAQNVTEFEVDGDRDVTLVVNNRVNVTGQLVNESGSDLSGYDVLVGQGETAFVPGEANETGSFAVPVGANQNYSVTAGQADGEQGVMAPRDGLTDFYQLAIVEVGDDDYSLDERTVPDSNGVLNVSVENESGTPVENALVTVIPTQAGTSGPSSAGLTRLTDEGGYLAVNDRPGIEAAGNYTIRVERPPNADRFVDETHVRTVNVTNDETVEVTLNEVETVPEPDIGIQSTSLESSEITAGDSVTVDVTLENAGEADGTTSVELTANGEVSVPATDVSVSAGGTNTVTLTQTIDEAGSYDLDVSTDSETEPAGTVTVEESSDSTEPSEPGSGGSANVTIVDTELSDEAITAGEDVLINVTLNNTADEERTINVSFFKDDELFHEQQYNVSANTNRTVSLPRTITDAGTYNISVQNDDTDERYDVSTVTVKEDDETSSEMPGFGIVPAIAALLGVVGILKRQRR